MDILKIVGEDTMKLSDFRQTSEWIKYLETKLWKGVKIKAKNSRQKIRGVILKIGFWPWTMLKIQRSVYDIDLVDLKKIKKANKVINTVIEPLVINNASELIKNGYRQSRVPYLAMKTVVIDLRQTKEIVWQRMSENAKRLIKKNKEVEVLEMGIEEFHQEWKKWTKVWIMTQKEMENLAKAFGNKMKLWVAKDSLGNHSGLISLCTSDTFNYYQTWTSDLGRKSGAHYKLVWETMMWAKDHGIKYYDFEGIYDEKYPIKKWIGFTEFKKKFGGDVITHPGSFMKWL